MKPQSQDFVASVVVFLVALPLCLGIAIASGVPPAAGLITGIIGGILVGLISGSPLQVSGPAAGLAVIIWELVREHGLETLGIIVLLAGFFQVLAGWWRIGQWFRAISPAVVYGMLAGIGVLIFAGQFHVMVDDKPQGSGLQNLISIPKAVFNGIFPIDGSVHEMAASVGLFTILTLIAWNRFRPKALRLIPGPLVAVILASAGTALLGLKIQHVQIPANLLESVNLPSLASLGHLADWKIVLEAMALAFVASAETLLSAAAVDRMHQGPRAKFDRELMAQGVGNMACGVAGALPMTGVIVRSAANVEAGARTRYSAVLHGIWLLVLIATAPFVLERIPTASLAAVLVYTGYKLVNPANIRRVASYGRIPLAIYGATLVGIVAVDLLTGVLIGIALSIFKLVYKVSHLDIRMVPHTGSNRVDLFLEGAATFVRLPKLSDVLEQVPAGTELHVHVEKLYYIDHTCLDLLCEWEALKAGQGCRLVVEWDRLAERYNRGTSRKEGNWSRAEAKFAGAGGGH